MKKYDVLVIDDEKTVRWGFEKALKKRNYNVHLAEDGIIGLEIFLKIKPPVTILDMRMPGLTGLEVLKEIRKILPTAIVIMVTAYGDMGTTIEAMKYGAYNFVKKPFDTNEVLEHVEKGLKTFLSNTIIEKTSDSSDTKPVHNDKIIGTSAAMLDIYKLIGKIATTSVTVLITGESGAGKEMIAQAIHSFSLRDKNPFIPINCTAIPEHLIESELFGHEKGAFTGATSRRTGKFELANHGTIFLDEIADMPIEMQAKLLRVLQEMEIVRVGGTEQIQVDVRIVAATNCDLEVAIAEGKLREDLYHRLKVIQIQLPPLRERMEDVPSLISFFLDQSNKEMDKNILGLNEEALIAINEYNWPGNVRELKNSIESAVAICLDSNISLEHLPPEILRITPLLLKTSNTEAKINKNISEFDSSNPDEQYNLYLKEFINREIANIGELTEGDFYARIIGKSEKYLIEAVFNKFNQNQVKTAKFLGINRNTLRSKMEKYNIQSE